MSIGSRGAIGLIVPFDCRVDREFWRWTTDDVDVLVTRTGYEEGPVGVELAERLAEIRGIEFATRSLTAVRPDVVAFGCTSSSFIHGRRGEEVIRDGILRAGATQAITASGALVAAARHLGIQSLGVATPYTLPVAERLRSYLGEFDIQVTGLANLGIVKSTEIAEASQNDIANILRSVAGRGAEAVFLSCNGLETIDLIAGLEAELGMPVLTANQVLFWLALRQGDLPTPVHDQRLFQA